LETELSVELDDTAPPKEFTIHDLLGEVSISKCGGHHKKTKKKRVVLPSVSLLLKQEKSQVVRTG
jgi:hypothetical protein